MHSPQMGPSASEQYACGRLHFHRCICLCCTNSAPMVQMKLSDKHDQLAYTLTSDGGASTAFVKEIATGVTIPWRMAVFCNVMCLR